MHKQYKSTAMHRPKHTTLVALLALVLALSGLLAPPMRLHAAGTIVYVNAGASGTGDGSSWADAFPSLADALAGAAADTEIWVAAGTYKPTSGTDRTATFLLKDGVAIYGGFAGNETQRDQRDWQTNVTTLSGDLNGDDSGAVSLPNPTREDNSYSVVTGATGATLDGVTIKGGYANDSSGGLPKFGGGLHNANSSPTVANVIFDGNVANFGGGMYNTNGSNPTLTNVTISGNFGGNGGGMYNDNSSPTLANVTISDNVSYVGGGMHNTNDSNPTLTDVIFDGNAALLAGGGYGGGMYNTNSSPTLTHVTFSGNTSASIGGGMYNIASSPVLTHVTFDGNSTAFDGGGLYSTGLTNLTLTDVTFSGNVATSGRGGGMYAVAGPTLTNVTFSGNVANFGGGLITFFGNNATLTNVTISGNSATYGGGMLTYGSSNLTLTNVTISGNSALIAGGGMYNLNGSNPQVRNSILWSNGSSNVFNGNDVGSPLSVPVFSSSIVQGAGGSAAWNPSFGTDGGGNLDADPLFVTPVPAPAPTTGGDLHLGPGSPALNTGNNSFLPAGVTTDLDGNPRIVGGSVDMGAYESQVSPPANPTLTTTATDASGASTLVSDSATLSEGSNPTGSITFNLYGPSATPSCTNLVFTSSPVTVNGNGTYGPVSFSPTAVGAYYWVASYSGDGNNSPVSGTCGDAGETSTVSPGAAQVVKTVNGATPGGTQLFTFQLRAGASVSQDGTTLEQVEASSANNWTINFTTPLVPGQQYQLCEWVLPGWNTNLGPNLFVPNSITPPSLPNPDVNNLTVCTDFVAAAGQTTAFNVDNTPPPGGRALAIGFWKNWASCGNSNGNQKPVLDQTLAVATGMTTNPPGGLVVSAQNVGGGWPNFAPTYALVLKGDTAAPDDAPDCTPAVNLLNKRTIDGKTKKANDPLFNMAAQLVAAQLNYFAGAGTNGTTTINVQRAVLLLGQYGFNGLTYSPKLSSADASTATCLATQLDNYNNDRPVNTCP